MATNTFVQEAHAGQRQHRATRALQKLVEKSPGTGSLSLFVRHRDSDPLPQMPWASAWTDGKTVCYAPEFEKFSFEEKIGVAAHELMHVALRHNPRRAALKRQMGYVDGYIYNIAADAIINQVLIGNSWLKLPGKPPILVELLKTVLNEDWEPKKALAHWSVEALYRALVDKAPKVIVVTEGYGKDKTERKDERSPNERTRAYGAEKGFEEDIPDSGAEDDYNEAKEAEEARAWAQRLIRAQAGDGSRGILREVIADLPRVRTPWEHILRSKLAKALRPQVTSTWNRPNRRYLALSQSMIARGYDMPYEPGLNPSAPAMRLVVAVDTSGSIDDGLLKRFAAEICAMQSRTGAHVTVIVADDRIHGEWELEVKPGRKDLGPVRFHGQGGTNFGPAIARANELKASMIVYLTDLQGPAEVRPNCPIIWAVPAVYARDTKVPFGQLVALD